MSGAEWREVHLKSKKINEMLLSLNVFLRIFLKKSAHEQSPPYEHRHSICTNLAAL